VYYNGRFHNPWPSFKEKTLLDRISDVRRLWSEPKHDHFNPSTYPPSEYSFPQPYASLTRVDVDTHLPLHTPDFKRIERDGSERSKREIGYTWLGHATSVVQVNGLNILTDPWFSQRASAWQCVGPRRFRPPACSIDQLPPLDVILLSHSHFDHLDYNSVRTLHQRVSAQHRDTGRPCRWFVPLGMKAWLKRWVGMEDEECVEMDWWEERAVETCKSSDVEVSGYSVTCVGAQHWTSRLAMVDNRWQLWCGFVLTIPPSSSTAASASTADSPSSSPSSSVASPSPLRVYYSGDTGYCSAFREIGAHFSHIDLSLIPIGAYEPEWLLNGAHVHPRDSVRIHQDVHSRNSVAVHWGTVVLSKEMVMAPKLDLQRAAQAAGLEEEEFITTAHGKTMVLNEGKWS
jgi:N-acyl-phosphatidylethanolamine-hydrolysing phospholipase D